MSRSIPDRWLEYKPYGTVIKGTKILPFKVPLKAALNNNLEPDKRFTTSMLLEAFPRLKFIIDLTNTNRYYDEKEFTKSDIKYEKIMVHGREVPPLDVVKKFFKTMDDFTSACGEDDIIGVHCTHGVNRTGYFICRYLFQQLGWKLKDCLKAFEEARGYPIEREIYVTALKRTPREKLDTSKPTLSTLNMSGKTVMRWSFRQGRPSPYSIEGRRRFAKDGPFSLPHFGYAGPPPGFRPRPSPPHIPPIPPLSGPLPLYGPRPFRYGPPPPRPVMPPPPPRSRFPIPCFPPPCAARMASGTRLPHAPSARLPHAPSAQLPPLPPPPPPPPPPKSALKRTAVVKRPHKGVSRIRIEIVTSVRGASIRQNRQTSAILPKLLKEQDFTVDTFEENLLAVSGQPNRRLAKGRYNVPLNSGRTAPSMANAVDEGEQRLLK